METPPKSTPERLTEPYQPGTDVVPLPPPSEQPLRFIPGQMVAGRYRIVLALGKGGMGEVYRADDLKLGQPVALKFLPQHLAGEPARLARFHDEVRLARQVSHPNVCRVHDLGEAEGQPFLSMEFIDGEDLARLLRRIGRLPPDRAGAIGRQVCLGLAAAHARGVLHCDLKPANVMLDGQGQVLITDFGVACLVDHRGGQGQAGTPAYMAPEQLAGKPATVQSDLYSLGLLLYELFTGKRARFPGQAVPVRPLPVADLDPAVQEVILRCLENEPQKRPHSALAVAAALSSPELREGKQPSPGGQRQREPGQVFISCSQENEGLVLPLVNLLRASGQKVFLSVQDLEYGTDRQLQVAEAIRLSKRFLLFWSESSRHSSLVREEYQLALATSGCKVVPILLDQTPLPAELECLHGPADLAPLVQALNKGKWLRRWPGVIAGVVAVIVALAVAVLMTASMTIVYRGPSQDVPFLLLAFLLPLLMVILWRRSCWRRRLLYSRVVQALWATARPEAPAPEESKGSIRV